MYCTNYMYYSRFSVGSGRWLVCDFVPVIGRSGFNVDEGFVFFIIWNKIDWKKQSVSYAGNGFGLGGRFDLSA
jgi:hypothetical protein